MNLHEFYQKHYFFEMERKQHLTRELTLPVGVIIILGGAIFAITQNIIQQTSEWNILTCVLGVLLSVSCILVGIAILYLIKSYHNYEYSYIATSQKWDERLNDLEKHYSENGGDEQDALDYLEKEVISAYARSADINTYNNDEKSEYLDKAKKFLIMALIAVIISGLIYLLNYYLIYTSIESQVLVSDSIK